MGYLVRTNNLELVETDYPEDISGVVLGDADEIEANLNAMVRSGWRSAQTRRYPEETIYELGRKDGRSSMNADWQSAFKAELSLDIADIEDAMLQLKAIFDEW